MRITQLFTKAKSQLENTQLKANYQSFQDILKFEPVNSRAKSGIYRIAERHLALARTSAIAEIFDEANEHINSVMQIAPTHDRLASTQQEIANLKNAYLDKQAKAKRAQQPTSSTPAESNKINTEPVASLGFNRQLTPGASELPQRDLRCYEVFCICLGAVCVPILF